MLLHIQCDRNLSIATDNDLIEIIEREELVDTNPEIAVEVCKSLVNMGTELANPARTTALIAESLTTITIQLHRQTTYREK